MVNGGRSRGGDPAQTPWVLDVANVTWHSSQIAFAVGRIMAYNNNITVCPQGSTAAGRRAEGASHFHLCGPGWVRKWPHASVSPLAAQECSHPADSNCDK